MGIILETQPSLELFLFSYIPFRLLAQDKFLLVQLNFPLGHHYTQNFTEGKYPRLPPRWQ